MVKTFFNLSKPLLSKPLLSKPSDWFSKKFDFLIINARTVYCNLLVNHFFIEFLKLFFLVLLVLFFSWYENSYGVYASSYEYPYYERPKGIFPQQSAPFPGKYAPPRPSEIDLNTMEQKGLHSNEWTQTQIAYACFGGLIVLAWAFIYYNAPK